MNRLSDYRAGVNLGHWLSQNGGNWSNESLSAYITQEDIKRIASWGMDHVRLPVDYQLFEGDDAPGVYCEEGLAYVDRCLAWCKAAGLNMVLDLHEAPGYSFFNANESDRADAFSGSKSNSMFTDEALQERFLSIWRLFATRYRTEGRNLAFDILNEIVLADTEPWNALWLKALAAIREIDGDRTVIIGGNRNADASELEHLVLTDDEGVVYTFHFYEPGMFTHQRSPFIPYLANYQVPVTYPFAQSQHQHFFNAFAAQGMVPESYKREWFDRAFLEDLLKPVAEFITRTGKEVFCGEFGVNEFADHTSTVRWYQDFVGLLNEMQIGHTAWSYVGFSTFMNDRPRTVNHPEIVKIISSR